MKLKSLLTASIVALAICQSGCTSASYEKAVTTSNSVKTAAQSIHQGNGQIDAVLFALTGLVNSPGADLKPQFKQFDAAVDRLESLATEVGEKSAAMQANGAAYFQQWDVESAQIQNEDIHSRSLSRKNEVAARLEHVRAGYRQTKAEFIPFLSVIKDIRIALATDLTAEGVAAIRPLANKANVNVLPLRESLSSLETDFRALGVSLSATNPLSDNK